MVKGKLDLQLSLFEGEERDVNDLPAQAQECEESTTEMEEIVHEEIAGQLNLFEEEDN